MPYSKRKPESIDGYIGRFPLKTQRLLKTLRGAIRKAAPKAEERISYGMPSFRLNGYLVYFAAWKNHIGFYPASSATVETFKKDLSPYEVSKGTVRFPLDKPLPLPLIRKIVRYRIQENLARKKKYVIRI